MTDLTQLREAWLTALATELEPAAKLRRELHQNPRLSGDERDTTDAVVTAMGLDFTPAATTGAVARIGGGEHAIGLRGELDALPGTETNNVTWTATNGAMHACGHDVHLAALTAVVRASTRLELPIALVPVLQPREETYPSGAAEIVGEGHLQRLGVAHMIGVHVHPSVPVGAVATGGGFVNAAAGELRIAVTGRGGHGAYPHHGGDVATAVGHIMTGLPEIVRRTVDPMDPAVISVGTVQLGTGAANVLPSNGLVLATIRTTSTAQAHRLAAAAGEFVEHQARSFGCCGVLEHIEGEPELVNDTDLAHAIDVILEQVGLRPTGPMRSLGADDFSFFSEQVPSVMCFVGVNGGVESLHDPSFLPDEAALERVARAYIAGYLGAAHRLLAPKS